MAENFVHYALFFVKKRLFFIEFCKDDPQVFEEIQGLWINKLNQWLASEPIIEIEFPTRKTEKINRNKKVPFPQKVKRTIKPKRIGRKLIRSSTFRVTKKNFEKLYYNQNYEIHNCARSLGEALQISEISSQYAFPCLNCWRIFLSVRHRNVHQAKCIEDRLNNPNHSKPFIPECHTFKVQSVQQFLFQNCNKIPSLTTPTFQGRKKGDPPKTVKRKSKPHDVQLRKKRKLSTEKQPIENSKQKLKLAKKYQSESIKIKDMEKSFLSNLITTDT